MLNAERPGADVGGAVIAIHGKDVARTGVSANAVTALEQPGCSAEDPGGIDLSGAVHPSELRTRQSDARYLDVSNTGSIAAVYLESGSGGNGSETKGDGVIGLLLREQGLHVQQVINDAASGPNDSGAFAGDIPSNPKSRREVSVVTVVYGTDILAHLFETDRRLPIAKEVVSFRGNPLILIAKSQIQSDSRCKTPVVL